MRPSVSIVNLANLKIIFVVYLKKLNLQLMQNVQCKYLHARQSCKNFTHHLCAAVFSATFCYHSINASSCSKYCNQIADCNENLAMH